MFENMLMYLERYYKIIFVLIVNIYSNKIYIINYKERWLYMRDCDGYFIYNF